MRTLHQALLAATLCLLSTPAVIPNPPDSTSAYWTAGIRFNQGHPFGLLGVTKRLSTRTYQYIGADLGGVERSITTQTALRITHPAALTLHALIGPQIETISPDPTTDETIDYLTASTGAILSYHRNQSLSFFIGTQYLWSAAPIKHWKFALGLLIPIDLGT